MRRRWRRREEGVEEGDRGGGVHRESSVTSRHSSVFLQWGLWFMEDSRCCKNLSRITRFSGEESTFLCPWCFSNTPIPALLISISVYSFDGLWKEKAVRDGYLFFFSPSPFCSFRFFSFQSEWLLNRLCILFFACVFIGGSKLGLNPSPEVVFETWKEAPMAQSAPPCLPHSLTLSLLLFLFLSPSHTTSHSLSVGMVVTLWRCYLHIISYYFIGSQSCQKTPSWNIQQA